jgi:hypothetical protein
MRMTRPVQHMPRAHADHNQQRSREQNGGNHERHARVMHAAHVHQGQNEQHRQAHFERVRLQTGHGGDECAHAGRNAHRRGENVVDHQSGGGQQARPLTQILAGHRVRAATLRIGVNGLPVTEVDNGQQHHNGPADRDNVAHPEQAQRDQQR